MNLASLLNKPESIYDVLCRVMLSLVSVRVGGQSCFEPPPPLFRVKWLFVWKKNHGTLIVFSPSCFKELAVC